MIALLRSLVPHVERHNVGPVRSIALLWIGRFSYAGRCPHSEFKTTGPDSARGAVREAAALARCSQGCPPWPLPTAFP